MSQCRQSVWSWPVKVCVVCHKNVNIENECKMCNECWKEFKGWMRSFTRTECALTALQLVLLVLFVAFLTFLILHLLACSAAKHFYDIEPTKITHEPFSTSSQTNTTLTTIPISSTNHTTLSSDIECTWRPSQKTDSVIHYYDNGAMSTWTPEPPDGDLADDVDKSYVLALGKVNIQDIQDIIFGCILTIISEYCTLTAASCIESIEEVDSVDTFVIIERYGDGHIGQMHTVSDVLIHPEYQGISKKYDVAVLRSEDSLIKYGQSAVKLPSMLDALMITIGEEFNVLGYGSPRIASGSEGRGVGRGSGRRAVRVLVVRTLAGAQCGAGWAPRHLAQGAAAGAGAGSCGAAPLCAGPARAPPACNQCAGAPLLRDSRLVGVLAAGPCGEACGPALYVNVATVVDCADGAMNKALAAWSAVMALFTAGTVAAALLQYVEDAAGAGAPQLDYP
ncbi:PREDICTED: uncharacterized protein LOC106116937 [Papilio xuthus]|uniref:Uncharacterized protein LOC106116937 n=1 Tax=Papilio xuthus TaxID=66420 RepID=A0AAJ6Z6U9_PAPXU|nr:PREDICTED: uncharacterized protein LOC106116937 [Papilio xuthus]